MTPRFNDTASDCAAYLRKLDSYVDGELAPGHEADVTTHTRACPMCREHVALTRSVRQSLKNTAHASAPSSLRSRVVEIVARARERRGAALRAGAAPSPRVPMRYAMALAVLAGALSAAGLARLKAAPVMEGNLRETGAPRSEAGMSAEIDALLDDLVALHKRPPVPEMTNPDELNRFDLDVGVPVRRPAFHPFDAQFKGARLYMSREGRAALLQYTVKGDHRVSVYVFDPRVLPMMNARSLNLRVVSDRPVYIGKRGGYSIAAAEQGGVGVALASDLDDDESSRLALAATPQ